MIDVWGQESEDGGDQYRGIFAITRSLEDQQTVVKDNKERHLDVRIGSVDYLLDASCVTEIIMLPRITFVPNSPQFIEGVINLRGRILPVLNLKKVLGQERSQATLSTRILVCDDREQSISIGLLVDGISGMIGVTKLDVEFDSPPLAQSGFDVLSGLFKRETKLIGILDFQKILATISPAENTQQEDLKIG